MPVTATTFNTPCLQSLIAYRPGSKKDPNDVLDRDTLHRLKDSAVILKESSVALRQNTKNKFIIGNVTYMAHWFIPVAAYYGGAADSLMPIPYEDYIKNFFPSVLQSWLPESVPDLPCFTSTWMRAALFATGCYAFLSIANFNRKMAIQSYDKEDNAIEKEMAGSRFENIHYLTSMYGKVAEELKHHFVVACIKSPKLHEQLLAQAKLANNSLPYLREALVANGLSPRETSQVLRRLSEQLDVICRVEVGLRNSTSHAVYNTKFLANFTITPKNCLPHRAQLFLNHANQEKRATGLAQQILFASIWTIGLTIPITFAASHYFTSAKAALDTGIANLGCVKNAVSTNSTSILGPCLKGGSVAGLQWIAAASSTAFMTYVAGKWISNKIWKQKTVSTQEMQCAIDLTKEMYDAVADYLNSFDDDKSEVSRDANSRHEEKSSRSVPASKGQLAKLIAPKWPAIKAALKASGLSKTTNITQKLNGVLTTNSLPA